MLAFNKLVLAGALCVGFSSAALSQDMQTVRMGLSAFQDTYSVFVGLEKGFYKDAGINLAVTNTDWPGAQQLLVGGQVDITTSSDADIVLQNSQGFDATLAFPLWYYAGGALMFDAKKHDWKTLEQVLPTVNNDMKAAISQVMHEIKGARVGLSSAGAEYASFVQMLTIAGMKPSDFTIVNLPQEDLPPALISGSIDLQMSGTPQRMAVMKQGYSTLIDQTAVPETIAHCGFTASRAWVDAHPELSKKLMDVILKTVDYVNKHPEEGYNIISTHLKSVGVDMTAADVKLDWNHMEYLPDSEQWLQDKVVNPNGQFYWKSRLDTVVKNLTVQKHITAPNVPLEDMYYALKLMKAQ